MRTWISHRREVSASFTGGGVQGEGVLAEVERALGVQFPSDYRAFIASRGGVDEFVPPAGDFLSIYAQGRLIEVNAAAEAAERFPGGVIIGG
ncbi:SMI1/KNR4 family protein [Micromonospora arborensis]|uniref:SMI1/KNR4 family protein n=1 Tax=Micromonospora arborensis TaxID=2116518 RepID=UPI0033CD0547